MGNVRLLICNLEARMKQHHQKTSALSTRRPVIERIERMHPLKMINYLIISVSCILFAVMYHFSLLVILAG